MSKKSKQKLFKKIIQVMKKKDNSFSLLGHCMIMAGLEVPLMVNMGVASTVSPSSKESSTKRNLKNIGQDYL